MTDWEYSALTKLCGGVSRGKQIILLNGPSSSGKSTLAVALRKAIAEKSSEKA